MARLPVIEGVSRVALIWAPLPAVNVMHFHQDSIDLPDLYGLLNGHFTAGMWNGIATTQSIVQIKITALDGTSATQSFGTDGSAKYQGQTSGEPIPQVAYVLSLHSLLRGRSARGRTFLGPAGEGGVTAGITNTTARSNLVSAWDAFQAAMVTANTEQVVASYKLQTALTVVNYSCRPAAGTMRPRQSRLA